LVARLQPPSLSARAASQRVDDPERETPWALYEHLRPASAPVPSGGILLDAPVPMRRGGCHVDPFPTRLIAVAPTCDCDQPRLGAPSRSCHLLLDIRRLPRRDLDQRRDAFQLDADTLGDQFVVGAELA